MSYLQPFKCVAAHILAGETITLLMGNDIIYKNHKVDGWLKWISNMRRYLVKTFGK
ncbi:hypothetical protein ECA1576 [Pectobacterium atrosepticum SCRI1043]|uniref:Uncharacterized protein n=1 Tax=Pectobacterium atrosepticum (strain SCRI 1043 / ATCC BAA-672) TaxID=218491 RepID=Q6D6V4_PECAS|nr:hypothetical protein ECA1576 [Pectobacterium atrosepticum SCRI1043]